MERQRVSSSNLASVGYDAENMILEVEFRNGSVYRYSGVPFGIYTDLLNARSKGRYFHDHIRERYRYKRIKKRYH